MSRLEQLRKMWDADRSDPDVPYMIAQEHAAGGDHAQAVEWFTTCLTSDEDYLYAYFHKARSLEELGKTEEAVVTAQAGLVRARVAEDQKATDELRTLVESLGGDA